MYLCYYLPLEKGVVLHLKFSAWFWRRFLNFVNLFSLFRYYLPFEISMALHLNKLEFPSPKDALCQVWFILLAQWFCKRRWKCEEFTDINPRHAIRKAHKFSVQLQDHEAVLDFKPKFVHRLKLKILKRQIILRFAYNCLPTI